MIRCAKCGVAISGGHEVVVGGKPYHVDCRPLAPEDLPEKIDD